MSELTDLLLQGPRSAPELRQRLAISQATFSRLVAREDRVIRFGKARATRYALLRPYRGIERIPVWRVDDAGKAHKFADIQLCWPQGSCLVTGGKGDEQWFDGLPWYLTDLRPQGFLGRAWGRNLAGQLNLTEDIRLWQEEDVLYALTVFNGEYTGGWLVGERNYQRWITALRPAAIPLDQKLTRYEQLAHDALAGEIVGSSAGGEQPKFTCYVQTPSGNKHVLVKFTVPQQTAVSQRWGDLLIAESIAAQILCDGGIHAIESTVLVTSNRQVFLEAERFDCKGNDGRLPIVSLEAVQSEFISSPGSWPEAMRRLCEQQFVTHQSVAQTEVIWAFGRLIANSDMHAGNLSFYLSEPPFALTPVYDMLPMAYAPNSAGMLRDAAIEVKFDLNVSKSAWLTAIPLAQQFWQTVAGDPRISEAFRHIAQEMPEKIRQIEGKVARMGG
ncbi:type II toxin-antitoxin system HipA family toxin YjjJ [Escherichia coli]|nr:type II toxin-antitoxin system HipA family toxin YjjJ [Escherichia coli]EHK7077876.1 type II toxin-antitoxin system HipA family toxin YjjJ [Escherichia coli]ELT9158125.1 type II toxin-antitoxin system HipA family toxin YjjJ [Escherichia coli]HDV3580860.1 type II toxin-antitoxin system HipA family toxin YjjJ [Escherichia coli]